jgi:hypothetical protein
MRNWILRANLSWTEKEVEEENGICDDEECEKQKELEHGKALGAFVRQQHAAEKSSSPTLFG